MNSPTMATTNRWLKLSIVILFISGVSAFFLFGGNEVLSLNALRDNRDALLGYTQEHYARALLLAILIYATATAMSLFAQAMELPAILLVLLIVRKASSFEAELFNARHEMSIDDHLIGNPDSGQA